LPRNGGPLPVAYDESRPAWDEPGERSDGRMFTGLGTLVRVFWSITSITAPGLALSSSCSGAPRRTKVETQTCQPPQRAELFAGQRLAGRGVELRVLDGLHAADGGDAQDVVRVGAARNIGRGPVEAQQDLAVGVGSRDVTHQFAGDVARVEVGKDQHVG